MSGHRPCPQYFVTACECAPFSWTWKRERSGKCIHMHDSFVFAGARATRQTATSWSCL